MSNQQSKMTGDLYSILYLERVERVNKLQRILKRATLEDMMFISLLVEVRTERTFKRTTSSIYVDAYEHSKLLFMYHLMVTDDVNLSLSYLPKEEFKVAISIIRGNELPLVEILEHIPTLYPIVAITKYVRDRKEEPLFYDTTIHPFSYQIKKFTRVWSNTSLDNNIPTNTITVNETRYPYSKELKEYVLGDGIIFPKVLLGKPTARPKSRSGTYITSYTLAKHHTEFIEYPYEDCRPIDWLVDDSYEVIGLLYIFNGKEQKYVCDTKGKVMTQIAIRVTHTDRLKIISCKLIDIT